MKVICIFKPEFRFTVLKLHFRTIGEGAPLIVMHGVFGSADNWQTLGKVFSSKRKVYLVDLRNHGNSPHSDRFDYDCMVEDMVELMEDEGMAMASILGHSMGGKVAMHLATKYPAKVAELIIVDIAPKYYPPHHTQIFEGFHAVKMDTLSSRKEADAQLSAVISNVGIRQFILKNLHRKSDGTFGWKLNLPIIESNIDTVGSAVLEEDASYKGNTLFIAGGSSGYITEQDHQLIEHHFPKAKVAYVAGAGHWVHAEKPKELSELVTNFFS